MARLWKCPLCHISAESREQFEEHCSLFHSSDAWLWTAVEPVEAD